MKQVNLYTDASLGNDAKLNVAGIGVVVENPETEERQVFSTYLERCDDINVAEMFAIYWGLHIIKDLDIKADLVRLVCDNKSCVDLLIGNSKLFNPNIKYTPQQKRRKLETKKWYNAIKAYAKDYDIKISHINGHRAYFSRYNTNNAMADILSRDGIRKYLDDHNKKDFRYKYNDSWKNKNSGRI